jgi:hypothetical protein
LFKKKKDKIKKEYNNNKIGDSLWLTVGLDQAYVPVPL